MSSSLSSTDVSVVFSISAEETKFGNASSDENRSPVLPETWKLYPNLFQETFKYGL
jgi:hypothetical protein